MCRSFRLRRRRDKNGSPKIHGDVFPQRFPPCSKQRDGILPDERIGRGERQPVRLCLTNQHPVKRITMQHGQSAPHGNYFLLSVLRVCCRHECDADRIS